MLGLKASTLQSSKPIFLAHRRGGHTYPALIIGTAQNTAKIATESHKDNAYMRESDGSRNQTHDLP